VEELLLYIQVDQFKHMEFQDLIFQMQIVLVVVRLEAVMLWWHTVEAWWKMDLLRVLGERRGVGPRKKVVLVGMGLFNELKFVNLSIECGSNYRPPPLFPCRAVNCFRFVCLSNNKQAI
jgi:hypothetical protein